MIDHEAITAAYTDLANLRESYWEERKDLESSIERLQNRVETLNVHQEAITAALDRYDATRPKVAPMDSPDCEPQPSMPFGGLPRR